MVDLREVYEDILALEPVLIRRISCPNPDYRDVKALAACYELQEFLAGRVPDLPEGEDPWEIYE